MNSPDPKLRYPLALHEALEANPLGTDAPNVTLEAEHPEIARQLRWLKTQLLGLPRVHAPPGFARLLSQRLAQAPLQDDHGAVELAMAGLGRARAPNGFASKLAVQIHNQANAQVPSDANAMPNLNTLPRIHAPPGFAFGIASSIAKEAQAITLARSDLPPTPWYFLGLLLLLLTCAAFALIAPQSAVVNQALLETLKALPAPLIATGLGVIVLAVLTLAFKPPAWSNRLAWAALAGLGVWQSLPLANPSLVQASKSSVVRLGDVQINGPVNGDVISLAGQIRLGPQAQVTGRVIGVLGELINPNANGIQVLHNTTSGDLVSGSGNATWPILSAANILRPLETLVRSNAWPWLLFGSVLLVTLAFSLARDGLEHLHPRQIEQPLSAGTLIVLGLSALCVLLGLTALAPLGLFGLMGIGMMLSVGFAFMALEFGETLRQRFAWPSSRLLEAALGLIGFAACFAWLPLALSTWLIAGAWGVGALVLAWRAGQLRLSKAMLENVL